MNPWELTDAQFWGELDAALLMQDFRASEQAEFIARFRAYAGRPPTARELHVWEHRGQVMASIAGALAQAFQSALEAQQRLLGTLEAWMASLQEAAQPRPRHGQPRPTPRTLHVALAANARAAPRLALRPVRSPATRRY